MTPDDYLEKLLDAIEQNNYWDVEAYSQKILNDLHKIRPEFREDLKTYIQELLSQAEQQYKKEREKQDLINEVVQPKEGERLKLK